MNTRNRTHLSSGRPSSGRPHSAHPASHSAPARAALPASHNRPQASAGGMEPPDEIAGGFSRILRTLPLTLAITALMGLLLVTITAAIAWNAPGPTALARPLSLVSLAVTALGGGIVAGRRNREQAVLGGMLSGVLFALVLILLSWAAGDTAGQLPSVMIWPVRLGTVVLHAMGAFLTRPRPHSQTGKHTTHR